MTRIAYVNGRYVRHCDAAVHVEDRGYQFADGVYEVCEVRGGRLIDERRHLARLARSLGELRIAAPMDDAAIGVVLREVVRRNRVRDGLIYLQVTRGVAPRNHAFPAASVAPALVVTARRLDPGQAEARSAAGVSVITLPETRWARVDIKSVALLPNVLAKQAAREAGAFEAWFLDPAGMVTEGASSNAWIVTAGGSVVTAPAGPAILRGITRTVLVEALRDLGVVFEERRFSRAEAMAATEAFLTAATNIVVPVIRIDGAPVGDGRPGPVSARLRRAFRDHAEIASAQAGPSSSEPFAGLER